MKPYTALATAKVHRGLVDTTLRATFEVIARSRGDAILAVQKTAAREWDLSRTEGALVRVDFLPETVPAPALTFLDAQIEEIVVCR